MVYVGDRKFAGVLEVRTPAIGGSLGADAGEDAGIEDEGEEKVF